MLCKDIASHILVDSELLELEGFGGGDFVLERVNKMQAKFA